MLHHFFCGLVLLASVWLTGCATLPSDVQRAVSTALTDNTGTRLGKAVAARALAATTRNDSGFALVGTADLALTSRMTLIRAAQKTLDLQYYAVHADATTERLFDALKEAANRGVRVRILLDDFNTAGENAQILKFAFEPNVEMRLFNPLPSSRGSGLWRIVSSLSDAARLQRMLGRRAAKTICSNQRKQLFVRLQHPPKSHRGFGFVGLQGLRLPAFARQENAVCEPLGR